MEKKLFIEVHYKLKPDMREEFIRSINEKKIAELSRKEQGNRRYDYFYPVDGANEITLFEIWDTEEDQINHSKSEHFKMLGELKNKYVEETQIEKYFILS